MTNGFVNFPINRESINKVDSGRTLVYICVFDVLNSTDKWSDSANIHMHQAGTFVSDDVMSRPTGPECSLDNIIELEAKFKQYDSLYFPYEDNSESIPLQASICVGWIECSFENKSDYSLWNAGFSDLTKNGREVYYLMKKLHHNKEVRILTFSE